MAREYWVTTDDGVDVSGPYSTEQAANEQKNERQGDWIRPLIVVNSDDAY